MWGKVPRYPGPMNMTPDELRALIARSGLHSLRAATERLADAALPEGASEAERKRARDRAFENIKKRVKAGDPTIPPPVIPAGVSGMQWTNAQVEAMIRGDGGFSLTPPRGAASATYRANRQRRQDDSTDD